MFQTQHAGVIKGFLSCYFYSSFYAVTKHDAHAGLSDKDLQPETFLDCMRLHPLVWLEALKKEMYTYAVHTQLHPKQFYDEIARLFIKSRISSMIQADHKKSV